MLPPSVTIVIMIIRIMMIKIMIISIVPPPVNEAGQGTHLIRMRIVTVPTITVATICVNQILVRILGLLLNDGL